MEREEEESRWLVQCPRCRQFHESDTSAYWQECPDCKIREREEAIRRSEARTNRNLNASGPSVGPSRFS